MSLQSRLGLQMNYELVILSLPKFKKGLNQQAKKKYFITIA